MLFITNSLIGNVPNVLYTSNMTIYIRISGQKGWKIDFKTIFFNTHFLIMEICDFEKAFDCSNYFVGANTDILYVYVKYAIIVIKTNPWKMILAN